MDTIRWNEFSIWCRIGLAVSLSWATIQVNADEYAYKPSEKYAIHPLRQGEKWETDDVLRKGMDNIRIAITASQSDILKEKFRASEYVRLSQAVDKNITYITKNFKLKADVNRAFYIVVLADMTDGVKLMRSSNEVEAQRLGALGVLQSLRNYGLYFQHPNWNFGVIK